MRVFKISLLTAVFYLVVLGVSSIPDFIASHQSMSSYLVSINDKATESQDEDLEAQEMMAKKKEASLKKAKAKAEAKAKAQAKEVQLEEVQLEDYKSTAKLGSDKDCLGHIFEAEEKYSIPSGLLLAISLVESGQNGKPHPYALNLNGQSVYPKSLQVASQHIRNKNGSVKRNISVGCMQLQVSYHKKHFDHLDQMLVPSHNVDYAAQFLKNLYKETKSWNRAVKRYNGGSPTQTSQYLCKVHHHMTHLESDHFSVLNASHCGKKSKTVIAHDTKEAFSKVTGDRKVLVLKKQKA